MEDRIGEERNTKVDVPLLLLIDEAFLICVVMDNTKKNLGIHGGLEIRWIIIKTSCVAFFQVLGC